MAEDADEALALLADMTRATDAGLRELARRLAGRLVLDVARRGPARPRGSGRIAAAPYQPDAGDLDIDASTEAIVEARRGPGRRSTPSGCASGGGSSRARRCACSSTAAAR